VNKNKVLMDNIDETSDIKTWAEWFERRAQYYDDPLLKMGYFVDGQTVSAEVMMATIDDVWKKLRSEKENTLLDVGGGVGLFAHELQSRFKSIVTTDISLGMASDGRKMHPDGIFFVCSAAALPFSSSSFDRLLCYSVFHYLQERSHVKKVLSEFSRVVKNGGMILIGDVPSKQMEAQMITDTHDYKTNKKKPSYYPPVLAHDLSQLRLEPDFFVEFCRDFGLSCRTLKQDIKGKVTSSSRFDILIEVAK
jgi:ubiquinone/menaquinone biosynthesis C-methylase UbiE